MLPRGVELERARQCNAGSVFRGNARELTERGQRRTDNELRKSFLVDVRDIENLDAAGTVRGVEIFAAQPDVLNVVTAVFVGFTQNRTAIQMLFIIRGVRD